MIKIRPFNKHEPFIGVDCYMYDKALVIKSVLVSTLIDLTTGKLTI